MATHYSSPFDVSDEALTKIVSLAVTQAVADNNEKWTAEAERALTELVELRDACDGLREQLSACAELLVKKDAALAVLARTGNEVVATAKEREAAAAALLSRKQAALEEACRANSENCAALERTKSELSQTQRQLIECKRFEQVVEASYRRSIDQLVDLLGKKRRKKHADHPDIAARSARYL